MYVYIYMYIPFVCLCVRVCMCVFVCVRRHIIYGLTRCDTYLFARTFMHLYIYTMYIYIYARKVRSGHLYIYYNVYVYI
jgi:hypothetical protein